MSVSFDAIRTELDAIWRPIAALRPTRCRRGQNSTRITQQLDKLVRLYRQSAYTTDRPLDVTLIARLRLAIGTTASNFSNTNGKNGSVRRVLSVCCRQLEKRGQTSD